MIFPPGEKIIEKKICRLSGQEFFVTDKDLEFYDKISPVFGGKKYAIPSPTLCPDERQKRRLAFRNERGLSFSSLEGQLSMYSKNGGYTSYQPKKYWSDEWSANDYGVNVDFASSILTQFESLSKKVPRLARSITQEENSNYVNQAGMLKNCYLISSGNYAEDLLFGNSFLRSKKCIDFLGSFSCEYCYEIIDCLECYRVFYCQECSNCSDSHFLYACSNCANCFGCINLHSKTYCMFNEQLTPEAYKKRIEEFSVQKHRQVLMNKIQIFFQTQVYRENGNEKSENCIGNKIVNSQNAFLSYTISAGKDLKYCSEVFETDNCYDISNFGRELSFSYDSSTVGHNAHNILFSYECWTDIADLLYCADCHNGVNNCLLSTGLRKAHHCILNTPYSVQEYETLCGKIIDHMRSTGEWGEFFPHELSPFGYNETVAQEYFPMTEEAVKARGWNWHTETSRAQDFVPLQPLPISQYDETKVGYEVAKKNIDEILAGIIQCEVTQKPFKIIKQELVFYIENNIPIPTKHPDQRHKERMDLRNPRKLYERYCMCDTCEQIARETHTFKEEEFIQISQMDPRIKSEDDGKRRKIITTYSPDRPEKVVCEECYRKLVY